MCKTRKNATLEMDPEHSYDEFTISPCSIEILQEVPTVLQYEYPPGVFDSLAEKLCYGMSPIGLDLAFSIDLQKMPTCGQAKNVRKKKVTFSDAQVDILKSFYAVDRGKYTANSLAQLAKCTCLTVCQIKKWIINRRHRENKTAEWQQ